MCDRSRWEERWVGTGSYIQRGNHNQDILHKEIYQFSIKRKIELYTTYKGLL